MTLITENSYRLCLAYSAFFRHMLESPVPQPVCLGAVRMILFMYTYIGYLISHIICDIHEDHESLQHFLPVKTQREANSQKCFPDFLDVIRLGFPGVFPVSPYQGGVSRTQQLDSTVCLAPCYVLQEQYKFCWLNLAAVNTNSNMQDQSVMLWSFLLLHITTTKKKYISRGRVLLNKSSIQDS